MSTVLLILTQIILLVLWYTTLPTLPAWVVFLPAVGMAASAAVGLTIILIFALSKTKL